MGQFAFGTFIHTLLGTLDSGTQQYCATGNIELVLNVLFQLQADLAQLILQAGLAAVALFVACYVSAILL